MEIYVALGFLAIALWFAWRKKHLSLFKNVGVPGPPPNILFGNLLELYTKGPLQCHAEWVKKYGRVVGYFYGMKPMLLVTDPEILKKVFIKDFTKFMNREAFFPLSKYDPHNPSAQSVINLPGKQWKNVRSVLAPSFTTAKMKMMAGSINSSIDTMVDIMKQRAESGKSFDIFDTYQRVTMDIITKTAFGVRTDVQTNFKSRLLRATQLIFSTNYRDVIVFFGLCWPYMQWFCRRLREVVLTILNRGAEPDKMLRKGLKKVLEHRRSNPQASKSDFLQLMIDTKISVKKTEVDVTRLEAGNDEFEAKYAEEEKSLKEYKTMTENEIVSSSLTVLLAGYETTSTALGFTTYLLGKYPEVQEKLHEEIRDLVESGQKLEYAIVNKLQYMDKVLNESMRVFPPVILFTNRYALEDVQYGDLKIPKDVIVQAPVYLIHHDPEFWPDPEKFDPDRFDNKTNINGITYMPFGVGPRNCLGMRFAQLEAKLVLAHTIYRFKVSLDESQKEKLETSTRIRILSPKKGVRVKLEPRDVEID